MALPSSAPLFLRLESSNNQYVFSSCKLYSGNASVCRVLGRPSGYSKAELEKILTLDVVNEIFQFNRQRTEREINWLKESLRAEKLLPFPCAQFGAQEDDDLLAKDIRFPNSTNKYLNSSDYKERYRALLNSCEIKTKPCVEYDYSKNKGITNLANSITQITRYVDQQEDKIILEVQLDDFKKGHNLITYNSQLKVSLPISARSKKILEVVVKKNGETTNINGYPLVLNPGEGKFIKLPLGPGSYEVNFADISDGKYSINRNGYITGYSIYPFRNFKIENRDQLDQRGLMSSSFVQSDHPEIIALAKEITKESINDRDKVRAVNDWIIDNIDYTLNITSADALSTLRSRKSLCEGYASLTAALLRAVGVPTLVVFGKVTQGDHAWNEVKLDGKWYALDVTFNDREIDASRTPASQRALVVKQEKDKYRYQYFLQPIDKFLDHKRMETTIN